MTVPIFPLRIVYLAAGAGGSYCGACARDATLARGLIARGHDVALMPLYTPLQVDGDDPSAGRVFYGGINVYLEQHSRLFRHTPRFVDRLLSGRGLLKAVARHAVETRPEGLGAMTVSVLRGPAGRQARELERLIRFLEGGARPDLIHLTNSLLVGLAPALSRRLGVPIVCGFAGEELFVDRLGAPFRDEALALMREHAASVDRFVAPGAGYADEMAAWLGVGRERIEVIRPGVDLEVFAPGEPAPERPLRIGYLSRLSPEKGLDLLCAAFRILARERSQDMELAVAGQASRRGRAFWRALKRDLARDGLADRVEFAGTLDLAGKVAFLRELSAFSVPSRQPERRGMAVLEALACGVPVVLPRRAGYDEIVGLTGGGVLVEPDDPGALAEGLARLLDRPDEAARMRQAAVEGINRHFSANRMVEAVFQLYARVVRAHS